MRGCDRTAKGHGCAMHRCASGRVSRAKAIASAMLLVSWVAPAAVAGGPIVRSYQLDVTLRPPDGEIEATAHIAFVVADAAAAPDRPTDPDTAPLTFFLHDGLKVKSIEIDGSHASFQQQEVPYAYSYTNEATRVEVAVPPGSPPVSRMTVAYAGTFQPSSARGPSDYMRIDGDGVLLRSYGYSLWFPVFLEAARNTYTVSFPKAVFRVPAELTPVFVGERVHETAERDLRISEWRADEIDLIDVQLTARRYTMTSRSGIHAYHLNDEDSREAAGVILAYCEKLNDLFATNYNPGRRFPQVHVMQMPQYGDISSGNIVGISDRVWRQFDKQDWCKRVLAHEFVHPFVQVRTDRADPLFALMIEGSSSYFHLPALATLEGGAFYEKFLARVEKSYLEKRKTGLSRRGGPLPPEKPLYEIGPDEIGTYKDQFVLADRALLFFDWLRRRAGDKAFAQFSRDLFGRSELDHKTFEAVIQRHIDVTAEELRLWLRTTEFPRQFHRDVTLRP